MAKRAKYATTIDISGPFFSKDPTKTFAENVQKMLEAMAREGEEDAKAQVSGLAGRMSHYTGWTTRTITGRVKNKSGKHWRKTAVVSAFSGGMAASDAIRTNAASVSASNGRSDVIPESLKSSDSLSLSQT